MSILSLNKVEYSIGVDVLLTDVSGIVNKGDRIGIVGVNGAGKSTLLKLITGEIEPAEGEIAIQKGLSLGYLKQREHFPSELSVMDVMRNIPDSVKARFEEEHGYDYERAIVGILTSMGFDESYYEKNTGVLSGGEKTRLALAALLVKEPDILLLDEPTNHLDLPTLNWLETYLKGYKGTLLIVSHDRYFLDRCVSKIFEIENCTLKTYNGNYSAYKEQKQKNYEIDLKHYEHQMAEIERQEEIIRRFKEHNTEHLVKRAQSREKRLAHIQRPVKPTQLTESLKIHFEQQLASGNDVVTAMDLSFGYDAPLFKDVNLDIKKHDRICLVGRNGIGKTTLLKILLGELMPSTGRVILGTNVMPGYYDQEQKNLDPEKTVLDEIHSQYIKYNQEDLRKLLGSFMFHGDDVFKKVKDLAGGEKARLSLLKLMMSGCNLLIFDEPTNHLDISAKEMFENAISNFPGTVIIVSHDRYLLQHIPTYICELTENGINKYLGKYDYYEEKSKERANLKKSAKGSSDSASVSIQSGTDLDEEINSKNSSVKTETWEEKKAREREERKAQKALAAAEENVSKLEAEIKALEDKLLDPAISTNSGKLREISEAIETKKQELDKALEVWMELN